jgi:hypothetical protein
MASVAQAAGLKVERMILWGTPLLTGHVRLASLASPSACWACYHFERFVQKLPSAVKEKACFSLSAVLGVV